MSVRRSILQQLSISPGNSEKKSDMIRSSQLHNELTRLQLDEPIIDAGFETIEFSEKIKLHHKLSLGFSILFVVFMLLTINPPIFFAPVFILPVAAIVFYNNASLFDKLTINFNHKEILLKNQFALINRARKITRNTVALSFSEIARFETLAGHMPAEGRRVTRLVAKSYDHPQLTIARFRWERDAKLVGKLLEKYVLGKPAINE
jgi:hypothetical protein